MRAVLPGVLGAALFGGFLALMGFTTACGGGEATEVKTDPKKASILRFWGLFNEANALRMHRDYARAATAYEQALALDPGHEDALYYLGQSRQEIGLYDSAREAFERLVTVNPESARGHLALGALLASPEESAPFDLSAAESHFRRAHQINAEETGSLVRLGEILLVRHETEEARRWLQAALHTNPKSVESAFLLGYIFWTEGDMGRAGSFYREALKAARTEAPIKGVLSEGDRRAAADGAGAHASPGSGPSPDGGSRSATGASSSERPMAQAAGSGADTSASAHLAAPPLSAPVGKTLFGAFSAGIRMTAPQGPTPAAAAGAVPGGPPAAGRLSREALDGIYAPVRDWATRLSLRRKAEAAGTQGRS